MQVGSFIPCLQISNQNDQTLKQTTLLNFCYIITTSNSTIFLTKQAMIYCILSKRNEQGSMLAQLYFKVRFLENIVDSIKWTLGITLRELKFDCFSYLTCCQGGRSKAVQPIPRLHIQGPTTSNRVQTLPAWCSTVQT